MGATFALTLASAGRLSGAATVAGVVGFDAVAVTELTEPSTSAASFALAPSFVTIDFTASTLAVATAFTDATGANGNFADATDGDTFGNTASGAFPDALAALLDAIFVVGLAGVLASVLTLVLALALLVEAATFAVLAAGLVAAFTAVLARVVPDFLPTALLADAERAAVRFEAFAAALTVRAFPTAVAADLDRAAVRLLADLAVAPLRALDVDPVAERVARLGAVLATLLAFAALEGFVPAFVFVFLLFFVVAITQHTPIRQRPNSSLAKPRDKGEGVDAIQADADVARGHRGETRKRPAKTPSHP